ncbi:MAG: 3-isopropylmalate dehydratase small subunit [Deltaproteobacteria bacterium]|nr:3-isopropylmalate dehydratase small subunit [Deltaproteobacteria bacterium]
MKFRGRVWKFGDDVNTDEIIPARYLSLADLSELGRHVMEGIDPTFPSKVKPGDIIVAGKNFGCGSSREHAPVAIRTAGVACVIARSFARIFFRNAFNMGLLILEAPEAAAAVLEGEALDVDTDQGLIRNIATGQEFRVSPVPPFMAELLRNGGLIAHLQKRSVACGPLDPSNKEPGKGSR